MVSAKSTVNGIQPELSRSTPLIEVRIDASTPDNSKAIFTAASLHKAPVCAGLPGLHEPVVVGNVPTLLQLAHTAW